MMDRSHHLHLAAMKGSLLPVAQQAVEANRSFFGDFRLREEFEGSPHRDTQSIYLRSTPWPIKDAKSVQEDLRVVDWPALQLDGRLRAVLLSLQEVVGLPMARAMIVSLAPDGVIATHRDEGTYAEATERFHFPIFTNPLAISKIGDEEVNMTAGDLWWYNKDEPHTAWNKGDSERIHLIFDCWRG